MIDALGDPQSVLVLGGTSEIALATIEEMPRERLTSVVLASRPSPARDAAVERLEQAGIRGVRAVDFDAEATAMHGQVIDAVFDSDDVDVVLLAFGVLGDQGAAEGDPSLAVTVASTNFTGAVSASLHVAKRLRLQGHGWLVVLSSVAGDRARRSNFIYGSTKAGLDAFAQGLSEALRGSGARVLIVRPGMVRTRMSAHLPEAPMTTDPQVVGAIIVKAIKQGKRVVYAPGPLRFLMTAVKVMPQPIFRRLPG